MRRLDPPLLAAAPCALACATLACATAGADAAVDTAAWDQRIAEARALRLWIASIGAAAVAAAWLAAGTRRGPSVARARDVVLVASSFATLFAWWHPHQGSMRSWHHVADSFHYYVGSKYFPELGYTELYRCAVVADAEAGLGPRVARHPVRNLETNRAESPLPWLRDPARCKDRFTPERWRSFTADLDWYRGQVGLGFWLALRGDHGYNPPPTWTLVGSLLANAAPAGRAQLVALTLIDPALIAAMFGALLWAFGWRVACIALIYWGTNQPASWEWVGGSILRFDWLFASVLAICCLRRGRPVAAGFALAWAVSVRIFPVVVVAGLGMAALVRMARTRRLALARDERRFAASFAAGMACVAALTLVAVGPQSWIEFARNSRTHLATDSMNRIGLGPLLAYRHEARAALTLDPSPDDAHARWLSERKATAAARRPLRFALAAGHLVLLAFALRRQPRWAAGVLGIGLLPFQLDVGCYYYGLLLAFACFGPDRQDVAAALLLLASASWWLGTWSSGERDVISAWTSLSILVFVAYATARSSRPRCEHASWAGSPLQQGPGPRGRLAGETGPARARVCISFEAR